MKKIIFAILFLMAGMNAAAQHLYVVNQNSLSEVASVEQVRRIEIADGHGRVVSVDGRTLCEFALDEDCGIAIGEFISNAVRQVEQEENISIKADKNTITIEGVKKGSTAKIYSIDGKLLKTARLHKEEINKIAVNDICNGIFLLSIDNKQLKIKK